MLKITIQQQTVDQQKQQNEEKISAGTSIIEGIEPSTPNNQKAQDICNGYDINCGVDDDELLLLGDKKHKQRLKDSKTVDKQRENENSEADNNFIVDQQDSESDYNESNIVGQNIQDRKKNQQKKLSKIVEDELGDEEVNDTRLEDKQIVRKLQDEEFQDEHNKSLLRVEDEYTSESEEQDDIIQQQTTQDQSKTQNSKPAVLDQKDNEKIQPDKINESNNNTKISISAGLSQMSPEDLEKLKQIMGANLKALKINQPEEALPLSAHHKYQNEDDILKKKLKNLQKMEAERQRNALEEYQRNENKLIKKVKIQGSGEKKESGIEGEGEGIAENESIDSEQRLLKEEIDGGFDPKDLQEQCDGWEIFKRKRIPTTMVRRYCQTLDQDYTKNKITVCAHANHIYDLYFNQRRPFMRTYADHMEKS